MKRKTPELIPIDREFLELQARIIGPSSAAQSALDDADEHGGPVRFFITGDASTIVVQKRLCKETNHAD